MITIDSLKAGYGKLEVLHDISLTVESLQFTAILGPNGSGKSTLLKSIFGLTHIFSGSIRFGDEELVGLPTEVIGRRGIAYVPQRGNIFTSMTVRENLLLVLRRERQADAERSLTETFDLFPILQKRAKQRAGKLSGGERQMLAIAMGWLAKPKVMLLDEPSAGLAPVFVNEVFKTLQTLSQRDITMVVVEQNARSVLKWCHYVYLLREGQLAFEGTSEACLEDEDTIKNYLGVGIGHRLASMQSESSSGST